MIGSFFMVCICCYCNGQCLHFYRFILFFRYVYVRTVHVSVVSTEARRLGPLEIQTQVVVTSVGSGVLPSDPLQEQYMLLTCLPWTETTHGGEAMYPRLVSDLRELQFGLSPSPGDISYLYLRMFFFTSKLWLLFTYWPRDFIMSFVE